MLSLAVTGADAAARVAGICAGQTFTNVDNLQEWVNPAWYNDYKSLTDWTEGLGFPLTDAEAHAFYDNTEPAGFGTLLSSTLESNYDKYECPSA